MSENTTATSKEWSFIRARRLQGSISLKRQASQLTVATSCGKALRSDRYMPQPTTCTTLKWKVSSVDPGFAASLARPMLCQIFSNTVEQCQKRQCSVEMSGLAACHTYSCIFVLFVYSARATSRSCRSVSPSIVSLNRITATCFSFSHGWCFFSTLGSTRDIQLKSLKFLA